jgi:hypothetical protein
MDQDSIIQYIRTAFDRIDVATDEGSYFFQYNPDQNPEPKYQIPFATLTISDKYDQVSNLDRPGVFRLNIGVGKESYEELVGTRDTDNNLDYTELDRFLPHPEYGRMHWVCILNPSDMTFELVKGLLAEAYDLKVSRYPKATTQRV